MSGYNCAHVQASGLCGFKLLPPLCGCACPPPPSTAPVGHVHRRAQRNDKIGLASTEKCGLQRFQREIVSLNAACCSDEDTDDRVTPSAFLSRLFWYR